MIGLGLNLGLGSHIAASGGGGVAAPTGTATMTQISTNDANRIYQRSTQSGGGQGKGQGTVPLTISSATAGTLNARCRASDGTTILQPEWQAATIANGATTANIAGVDARLGWFYLDIKDSTGSWQNGTTLIGMGALFAFAGQSLMARFIGRFSGDTGTYVSNSLTASPYSRVLATYDQTGSSSGYLPTVSTMPWQQPGDMADNTGPSSTGIGEFLNRMITMLGINCGGIGYAQGGCLILSYLSFGGTTNANWTEFASVISRAGGAFEGMFWGQGHNDSLCGQPSVGYYDLLTQLFSQITSINSFSGYKKYIWTIPNVRDNTWGTSWEYNQVRHGAELWCAANSATHVQMFNFALGGDAAHENQTGAITIARHMYRATRSDYGQSSGMGPVPTSITCTAASTYTVTFSDVGQTNLVLTGSPQNRMFLFPQGKNSNSGAPNDNRYTISTVTVLNKTQIQFTTSVDPGQQVDFYMYYPGDGIADPTLDNIYDDVNPDGLSHGRIVAANAVPLTCAGSGGSAHNPTTVVANTSPYNMTETSTTYGTAQTGFGQELTGGTAISAKSSPYLPSYTVDMWFTCGTVGAASIWFGGLTGDDFIEVLAGGQMTSRIINTLGGNGATVLTAGHRYHMAYLAGPSGVSIYLTDITAAGSGTRDFHDATPASQWMAGEGLYSARIWHGSSSPTGGALTEVAVRRGEKYSGTTYTAPSSPFVGNETDIVAVYHFDGNAVCAVGA